MGVIDIENVGFRPESGGRIKYEDRVFSRDLLKSWGHPHPFDAVVDVARIEQTAVQVLIFKRIVSMRQGLPIKRVSWLERLNSNISPFFLAAACGTLRYLDGVQTRSARAIGFTIVIRRFERETGTVSVGTR